MSYDLHLLRDRPPASANRVREHAVYREAERSDGHVRKPRTVADALEARSRPTHTGKPGHLLDLRV